MITKFLTKLILAGMISLSFVASQAQATKISVFLQNIYAPESNPASKAAFEQLLSSYKEANPDVEVDLIPYMGGSQSDYYAWLTTRIAAGDEPDVGWSHWYDRNARSERWLPLNEYLEGPNEYIPAGQPGHDRWMDIFDEGVMAQIRHGNGNWYQLNTNWVETGLYLNEDILTSRGLPVEWNNWSEFVDTCKALRADGIQPLGVFSSVGWSTYQWLDTVLISAAFQDSLEKWQLPEYSNPFMTARQLTLEEISKAVHEGEYNVNNPRFDTFLDLTEEVVTNCIVEGFTGIPDLDTILNLFLSGETAMAWLGTWNAVAVQDGAKFNFRSTFYPPFTSDNSPYVSDPIMYRVGGPSSSGQVGLSISTVDRGTVDAAIDFAKFYTAPANYQAVANSDQGMLTVINGVESPDVAKGFIAISKLPERGITDAVSRFGGEEFGTPHNRMMQSFMMGDISRDELKEDYQKLLDKTVKKLCEENAWEWCSS